MSAPSINGGWVRRVLRRPPPGVARPPVRASGRRRTASRFVAAFGVLLMPLGLTTTFASTAYAQAPVGQGFTVTPADLSFILSQIKISENHAATATATDPCAGLLGPAPNQVPTPLVSYGLRTVDGTCNNLQPGRDEFAAAHQLFPRLTTPTFAAAEPITPAFPVGPPGPTTYASTSGSVIDSEPRVISNLIVDQTATNPAAVEAAANPVRTQGNPGAYACGMPGAAPPPDCVPPGETLFIPNVTTDVGLSPPYNGMFTLFGQFFDHGVDSTNKGGSGTVFIPLKADDPLIAGPDFIFGNGDDLPPQLRFMVLTRATNSPGPDGILGNGDDVHDATNSNSPLVDQSQTYSSHASHQIFLREYADAAGVPVSTGKLLNSADGGMGTWGQLRAQAATLLGLQLVDGDVGNIPMIASDPYGNFVPGPNGLPQYVTASGLVEGNRAAPVPAPADVVRVNVAFLNDIAHHAAPGTVDDDNNPGTPPVVKTPDADPGTGEDNIATTYDDEMLAAHFVAGDGRVNENIGLTAVHQVFHSEHDRLVDDIQRVLTADTSPAGVAALADWRNEAPGATGFDFGQRLFQAARFINEMEYQHLVFEEFGRKVQPLIDPFTVYHDNIDPAVTAEFAHAVYRFGHSMLNDSVDRINVDGTRADLPLLDAFLNPPLYQAGGRSSRDAAGSIIMGMSDQVGNELDEFVTETLRNNLLGLPLDLATLNITRAREAGVPPLNEVRRQINAATNDAALAPYTSWVDFGLNVKHPESVTNFVAAYGQHPTITGATTLAAKRAAATLIVDPPVGTDPALIPADAYQFMNATEAWATQETGINEVDLWIGGLAERTNLFGGLLGSTFNYVFESQMTELQNADRFYYLIRTAGMNLRAQLEGNSFAELMMRNTTAHSLKADSFATADCKFQIPNLGTTGNILQDPASECDDPALLIRMPDGTIRYRTTNTIDPPGINGQAVYNGYDNAAGVDRIWGGVDNDTFWGNAGNDVIEGNDGADVALGGEGSDRITDSAGDDVPKGGPGNDRIDAGPGLDIIMGGDGADFTNGGLNDNETFGGNGNDLIIAGNGIDVVFGDADDDWVQGGNGQDLLCGDSCAPFFDDPNAPGHDVIIGQNGEDDYDAEGGDDIMIADAGVERNAGAGGFDWSTHERDTLAADVDLVRDFIVAPVPEAVLRDRYQEVEGLSGGALNDVIRGDSDIPAENGGDGFTGCDVLDQNGVNRIAGLNALVTAFPTPLADVLAASATRNCALEGDVWGQGNIILGGAGNDLIEGRGADDIIDGDRYLNVRLSVRDAAGTEIGTTDLMESTYQAGNPQTLQQAVFAGVVDPGNIVIVRELLSTPGPADVDTAVFSGPRADYDLTTVDGRLVVTHARGTLADGTDTLSGIERLQFSDVLFDATATVPAAPAITSVTAGNTIATVNFTPGATGGSPITSFTVTARAGTTVVQTVTGIAPTATSAVVGGLTNGTAVTFTVQAVNAVGTGPESAPSAPVTPVTTPGAPVIGTAVAGNAQATVAWTAPVNTGGSAVTSYQVEVRTGTTVVRTVTGIAPTATSTVVTGLTNGTAYNFRVRAVNAVGLGAFSAASNPVTPVLPDTTRPTLTARFPAVNALLVARAANVTATFSEPVANVNGTTVTLRNTTTNALITATVTYNATTRVATLDPNGSLARLTNYTVTLSAGIQDNAGNTLTPVTWRFTTGL
jgi:hypothetical protein